MESDGIENTENGGSASPKGSSTCLGGMTLAGKTNRVISSNECSVDTSNDGKHGNEDDLFERHDATALPDNIPSVGEWIVITREMCNLH